MELVCLHITNMDLNKKIEAVLLYKNEPISVNELSKILLVATDEVRESITKLQEFYKERGIVIVSDGEKITFGTSSSTSNIISAIQKAELSRDIGKAGLETMAIILYKAPVSRREIDYIRGVNSGFILRNLMVRGLVERAEGVEGERSFSYKPTLELIRYLGITKKEELPQFDKVVEKLVQFASTETDETNE